MTDDGEIQVHDTRDVGVSVTTTVADAVIEAAGFTRPEGKRWFHPDGEQSTWARDEALMWALVVIAERE